MQFQEGTALLEAPTRARTAPAARIEPRTLPMATRSLWRAFVERAKKEPILTAVKVGALGIMTAAPIGLIATTISVETPAVILSMVADLVAATGVVWFYMSGVFFDDEDEDHKH